VAAKMIWINPIAIRSENAVAMMIFSNRRISRIVINALVMTK
jgi:hypothetical protein